MRIEGDDSEACAARADAASSRRQKAAAEFARIMAAEFMFPCRLFCFYIFCFIINIFRRPARAAPVAAGASCGLNNGT
jgi:hypothetical protein